jgi:hypothetical protein
MTEARKARTTRYIPETSRTENTLFHYPDYYCGGLLKARRVLAVIFQRSIRLLPWIRRSTPRRHGEEI